MNSINSTIHGLASSLLLNVGLTSMAEKLDPVQKHGCKSISAVTIVESSEDCVWSCNFRAETGQ